MQTVTRGKCFTQHDYSVKQSAISAGASPYQEVELLALCGVRAREHVVEEVVVALGRRRRDDAGLRAIGRVRAYAAHRHAPGERTCSRRYERILHARILLFLSKCTADHLPKRDELLLYTVFALPKAYGEGGTGRGRWRRATPLHPVDHGGCECTSMRNDDSSAASVM